MLPSLLDAMVAVTTTLRRLLFSKITMALFAFLVALEIILGTGYLPVWFAKALATLLRNNWFSWLGSDLLFIAVTYGFLYLECSLLVGFYLLVRSGIVEIRQFVQYKKSH